jgi:hypothetical protein
MEANQERFRLYLKREGLDEIELRGFNDLSKLQSFTNKIPHEVEFVCYYYEENRWQRSSFSRRGYSIISGMDRGLPVKYYPFRGEDE